MIFDIKNWHWKPNFGTFLHLPITPNLKITWVEDFQAQNLQDFRIIIIRYSNEDEIKIQRKCQADKNLTILK